MLDPTYCGLPLVCKVGTSKKGDFQRILLLLVVGDALDFGKYFRFILQGSGDGSGKLDFGFSPHARRICRNASCSGGGSLSCKEVRNPASPPSPPSPPPQKNKIKSLVPCLLFICVWTRNRILSLHGLMNVYIYCTTYSMMFFLFIRTCSTVGM